MVRNKDHKLAHLLPPKAVHTKIMGQSERFKTQHVRQTVLRIPLQLIILKSTIIVKM